MRQIFVVIHPEATHHVDGLVGGWFDSHLTERGRSQAHAIRRRIRELVPPDETAEVFSSDLSRAVETAAPIGVALAVHPHLLPDLREKSYGVAGGQPQTWLDSRFVPPPSLGERLDHDEGIQGAEKKGEWVRRVYSAMDLITASSVQHQVVVTHGGCLTWIIGAWIGLPVEATGYAAFRSISGSISVLVEDDRFRNRTVCTLNDTRHLQ